MDNVTRLSVDPDRAAERRRLHFHEVPEEGEAPLTVGEQLRAARIRVGEDIRSVATALKIKREHLEALEEGQTDRLPARAYAVGFVRSYAEYLGLDANAVVARFKEEIGAALPPPAVGVPPGQDELGLAEGQESARLPYGWIVLFVLLMGGTLWGAFYLSQSADHLLGAQKVGGLDTRPVQSLERKDDEAPAVTTADPALATVATKRVPALPPAAPAPSDAKAVSGATAANRVLGEPAADARVTLKGLTNGVFVRVEDTLSGEAFFSGRVNEGDVIRVPNRPNVILVTRNAGALELYYDGRTLGPVGSVGAVLTSFPLSETSVGARALAQDAAALAAQTAAKAAASAPKTPPVTDPASAPTAPAQ